MFRVSDDEVQKILAMAVPRRRKATFDETELRELVARSYSITLDEKVCLVESIGHSSQRDVDALLTVLREEQAHFASINRRFEEAITAAMPVN